MSIKNKDKSHKTRTLIVSSNSLCFTDDDDDNLISNDFHLEKKKESNTCELSYQQKQIIHKNEIIKERLLTIDKIIELYPNLKKDKKSIVDNVLGNHEIQKKDCVLEKLNIKNKSIYKDSFGNLMDADVNLVGFWMEPTVTTVPTIIYHFFSDIKKIKTKISKNKKKINMMYINNMKYNKKY
jgi:hypothetical protein